MVRQRKSAPALRLKLLRDLRSGWKSFLAILIICSLAVVLYMGLDATWRGLDIDLKSQFSRSVMADLWVRGEISERALRDIEATPGVLMAQRRVTVSLESETLEEEPKINLVASEGEAEVCIPLLRSGSLPQRRDECMLSERFAAAHGLGIGDSLTLKTGDRTIRLEITGLGQMPEFVVASEGDELSPSARRMGFAFVRRETLDFLPFTEAAVRLAEGADPEEARLALQRLFEDSATVVISRDDIFGIKMAMEEAQQIRAMGAVFPFIFFLIAALITWTTMNRLVESQRLQIGSLFAIGYTRGELMRHYAAYGMLIAVLGSLLGLLGARYGLADFLIRILGGSYAVPDARPYTSPLMALIICAALVLMTGGASVLSARAELGEAPASLLRPKPPSKGKRVLLERVGWVWRRMPFSEKMILRNLFRSPVRLLMGLAGAAGCTALMLSGFGLKDSMDDVLLSHYTRTMHYDMRVTLDQSAPHDYAAALAQRAGADSYEEELITSAEILTPEGWRMKQIYVLADDHHLIALRDEKGQPLTLPRQGVALTRTASEDFGLGVGDELLLRNPGGRTIGARVVRVFDLQLNQGVYMSRSAYEELDLASYSPSHVLLSGEGLRDSAEIAALDGVKTVRTIEEERASGTATMEMLDVIVLVMVLFSAALELVVFYNLGQLNFSERIRELATLKVLGFTRREMKKLVLLENIIMTLMGLPIGLLLGPPLLEVVLHYGLPNTIQFVSLISLRSWLITPLITLAFAMTVNNLLGAKFKSIDMVEALKSVE